MAAISMVYPQYVWAKEYIFLSQKHWQQDREMFSVVFYTNKFELYLIFFGFSRFSASNSSEEVHRRSQNGKKLQNYTKNKFLCFVGHL